MFFSLLSHLKLHNSDSPCVSAASIGSNSDSPYVSAASIGSCSDSICVSVASGTAALLVSI